MNVLGGKLISCSGAVTGKVTGWRRDGYCRTDDEDYGSHVVCARVTTEFLRFTKSRGNNLDFLRSGDLWCLCAGRWLEAYHAGVAPPVILDATNAKVLDTIPLPLLLRRY